jgi:hypothetical protein
MFERNRLDNRSLSLQALSISLHITNDRPQLHATSGDANSIRFSPPQWKEIK